MDLSIIQVALDLPLERNFDFFAADLRECDIGRLVVVPFGNRLLSGVIVGVGDVTEVPPDKLKPVMLIQRGLPKFSADDFSLIRFCQHYYHHPFGPIALNGLPPAMRATRLVAPKRQHLVTITEAGREALHLISARAVAQRAMLAAVEHAPQSLKLLQSRHVRASGILRALHAKGWVNQHGLDVDQPSPAGAPQSRLFAAGPKLNLEQSGAVLAITGKLSEFAPFLLSGITGSGKTEVYLHVIAAALNCGKQAMVLMPEINLTPQFLRQLEMRFAGAHIVQQHSGLADIPRLSGYLDAQTGRADIVIGTRLAVFTPMPRLGVIIVDEEHDSSYKQQEGFRYSARDVAVFRAQQAGCAVVLGSATPSLETIQNTLRGRFTALKLTQRATPNAVLPRIDFIDLNGERTEDGLSATLIKALEETVKRGEQALVFINRRGYSPALVCAHCGWMPACKRCSARLVFHQRDKRLKCHHCGYQTRVPGTCNDCGSHEMVPAGQGTERVELALRAHLPGARIARVDRDSTRRRGAAEKIFDAAAAGELDVLVGTQMLSKGHDFPRITLVGVVNADGAMFSADFRAAERMVAQLMQVAGRAGRADLPGRVLIQTRFATHPLYLAVAAQDHARYAEMAMAERKLAHLPPYSFLALLRAEAKAEPVLREFMLHAVDAARHFQSASTAASLQVWDPVAAPLSRKAGFERQQLMVQAGSRTELQQFLAKWLPKVREHDSRAVKWVIDVDPLEV
jgi:primosomal protein N' (replication factor Y) (superfamily II helicase)